jgi:hypothetical protein
VLEPRLEWLGLPELLPEPLVLLGPELAVIPELLLFESEPEPLLPELELLVLDPVVLLPEPVLLLGPLLVPLEPRPLSLLLPLEVDGPGPPRLSLLLLAALVTGVLAWEASSVPPRSSAS